VRSAAELQELAQLLSQAERHVTRQLARVLEAERCSVTQWRTLMLLSDGAGHAMSELTDVVLLPAPSVTRLIDRMACDNLVYRKVDPRDRRRVLVHSSPRGRALHRRVLRRIEQDRETILADSDAAHLDRLAALLTDLVSRLR
jgi:DNA-binding MarR family transcriptional regulator